MNQPVVLNVLLKNSEKEVKTIEFNQKLLTCTTVIVVFCNKFEKMTEKIEIF